MKQNKKYRKLQPYNMVVWKGWKHWQTPRFTHKENTQTTEIRNERGDITTVYKWFYRNQKNSKRILRTILYLNVG